MAAGWQQNRTKDIFSFAGRHKYSIGSLTVEETHCKIRPTEGGKKKESRPAVQSIKVKKKKLSKKVEFGTEHWIIDLEPLRQLWYVFTWWSSSLVTFVVWGFKRFSPEVSDLVSQRLQDLFDRVLCVIQCVGVTDWFSANNLNSQLEESLLLLTRLAASYLIDSEHL